MDTRAANISPHFVSLTAASVPHAQLPSDAEQRATAQSFGEHDLARGGFFQYMPAWRTLAREELESKIAGAYEPEINRVLGGLLKDAAGAWRNCIPAQHILAEGARLTIYMPEIIIEDYQRRSYQLPRDTLAYAYCCKQIAARFVATVNSLGLAPNADLATNKVNGHEFSIGFKKGAALLFAIEGGRPTLRLQVLAPRQSSKLGS